MITDVRRRFQRFFVPFFARREGVDGKPTLFSVKEISIAGCFAVWDEARAGETIRFELPLSNGNWMPVNGKVVYRLSDGIGVKFVMPTQFEQELIAEVIRYQLKQAGLPDRNPFEESVINSA